MAKQPKAAKVAIDVRSRPKPTDGEHDRDDDGDPQRPPEDQPVGVVDDQDPTSHRRDATGRRGAAGRGAAGRDRHVIRVRAGCQIILIRIY